MHFSLINPEIGSLIPCIIFTESFRNGKKTETRQSGEPYTHRFADSVTAIFNRRLLSRSRQVRMHRLRLYMLNSSVSLCIVTGYFLYKFFIAYGIISFKLNSFLKNAIILCQMLAFAVI